ncbi:MAG: hypothetical protein PHX30_06070, partial [Candidatus Pacebacteria bacterium]|nr:hypothetical protein [Candidatus Paceibacterota bacterium]
VNYETAISSDLTSWQEELIDYTSQLGISFKYPEFITGGDSCDSERTFFVPTKIFEDTDNGAIYIMPEYYYDFRGESPENSICQKYIVSGKMDQNKQSMKNPFRGWRINIRNIEDKEVDISRLIKDVYGYKCKMDSEKAWIKDGISEIGMNDYKDAEGNQVGLGETVCPVNYVYKLLYSEEKKLAVSVVLGQECTFWGEGQNKCFDEQIAQSLEFE